MAKTTKAHREAVYAVLERGAFHAHFVDRHDDEKALRMWLASGRAHEDSDLHDAEMMAAALAEAEERGRLAERERCVRLVRRMQAQIDGAPMLGRVVHEGLYALAKRMEKSDGE